MNSLFCQKSEDTDMMLIPTLLTKIENLNKKIVVKPYTTPTTFRHNVRDEYSCRRENKSIKRKTL